ncbi:hypothetical protein Ae201684P_006455 [Aphanomyces euteiches]|nr:hypothetical protein Ae201684P_006455 [Aphanomyces euteiches]
MTSKAKSKRLTRRDLEARLAQYEEASHEQSVVAANSKPNEASADKKVCWTEEMIRALLELRLQRYAAGFQASRSNQQLSIMWEKKAMSLNLACSTTVPPLSVKTKFHSLKTEYSKLRFQEKSTGNNFFGDKNGLGHNEFASSGDLDEPIENLSDDIGRIKRVRLDEQKRQKKERRQNIANVADGLASLGQTLAKGLVDAATAAPRPADEKLDALLVA